MRKPLTPNMLRRFSPARAIPSAHPSTASILLQPSVARVQRMSAVLNARAR